MSVFAFNRMVPLKSLRCQTILTTMEEQQKLLMKVKVLFYLNGKGIPRFMAAWKEKWGNTGCCLFIQMELCQRTNLRDWLIKGLNPLDVLKIWLQILFFVNNFHRKGINHSNLKPESILLSCDGEVKVCGFGLAKASSFERHSMADTSYKSPKQSANIIYDSKADIYNLALILMELCLNFKSDSDRDKAFEDARNNKLPEKLIKEYPLLANIIEKMISKDPLTRPTAGEILSFFYEKKEQSNYVGYFMSQPFFRPFLVCCENA